MAKPKETKTNAMRVLEARKVPYRAHHYAPEIHSAEGVAQAVGMPAEQVFKTLVVMPERGKPILAIVPGDGELDLKALARAAGAKKLRMATQKEAEAHTGMLVGGISALGLLDKAFVVVMDVSVERLETVLVSAGERGTNLELAPADLVAVTRARVAPIVHVDPT